MNATQFYKSTVNKSYEMDGVPAADPIQCADYFKLACLRNVGFHWATGGDGFVDYWWYNREKQYPQFFRFITDYRQFKNGDFVIWPHKNRNSSTPFPLSHIAMYWEKSDGKKYMVGQNQPKKFITEKVEPDSVWAAALGAIRFRLWDEDREDLPYGKKTFSWYGIDVTTVRGPKNKGYDLHLLSGNHEYDVKEIDAFDSEKLEILAGVNANYFQMSNGRHLGCEGDGLVQGYQQIVPKQTGWTAFYQQNGETKYCDSSQYFYDQKDVDFVCTPYAVRLFHGDVCFKRSTQCGDKDSVKNTQTAALKFENGDWATAIFSARYPRDVVAFALRFKGIQDVILMDSGGSTQMFECTSGTRKIVKKTTRKVSTALVIARPAGTVDIPAVMQPDTTPDTDSTPIIDELQKENELLSAENAKLKNTISEYETAVETAINLLQNLKKSGEKSV